MQKASHSRPKPWDGKSADLAGDDGQHGHAKERITRPKQPKPRPRKSAPILLAGTLVAMAGLGAGLLIYPERAAEFLREQDWMTPSAAWSTVFPERRAYVPAVPPRSSALQEAARPNEAGASLLHAAASLPATTASLGGAKASARELPWLPEADTSADSPAATKPNAPLAAAPLLAAAAPASAAASPKVAVAPPEVAPVPNPSAPPAITTLSGAEVDGLIKRARAHIDLGDIAGARLLLQRAAAGREPFAMMALAETYDPAMLAQWGARGLKGDLAKARELYQAAAESGLAEARTRVLAVR